MNNKKFNKDLLDRIKTEDIKQTSKYVFRLKNIAILWFLMISIVLWSIAFSISFDYLINADWYLFRKIWLFKVLIVFIPLFWIIFLVLSSFFSYYNYRCTNKGYKLSLFKVFILNIFSSLMLAIILYLIWANIYIESKLTEYIPKYRSILVEDKVSRMIKIWQNEEKWLLIWKILKVWKSKLIIKDFKNNNWDIILNNKSLTNIRHRVTIQLWETIKIIWEKIEDNKFEAKEIRPFIWRRN